MIRGLDRDKYDSDMLTTTDESAILLKTRELCQTITAQPEFQTIRERVDAFMANDDAKLQYQFLSERGEYLQHKQQQGSRLTEEELAEYEQQRQAFINNPIAVGFLNAQQEMQQVQQSIGEYVSKTFELGRVPETEDMDSGSCGHGCGCHH